VIADPQVVLQLLVFDTGSNPDAFRRPEHAKPFPLFACSYWEFHCCRLTCAVQIFYARLQGMQTAAQLSLQTQGCPLPLILSSLLFTLVEQFGSSSVATAFQRNNLHYFTVGFSLYKTMSKMGC
jgi:hypothetical protein